MIGLLSDVPFGTVNMREKWQGVRAGLEISRTYPWAIQLGMNSKISSSCLPLVTREGGQERKVGGRAPFQSSFSPLIIMSVATGSC